MAKLGDSNALNELHARFQPRVLGVVRRRLGPALRRLCDSADLVQSVFEDMLRDLPRFEDRGEEAFRNWLYVKAECKVHDAWRRRLRPEGGFRENSLDTRDDTRTARGPGPATAVGDADERARLRDAVASLPADQQELLTLRLEKGLAWAEIADRLGLPSADAARVWCSRIVCALQRKLDE